MVLPLLRRPRTIVIFVPVFFIVVAALHYAVQFRYQIRNTISYATRPLWDSDTAPKDVIPHYYAEGIDMGAHMCKLHGWTQRGTASSTKVLDAVLMSSELDLLEIRMNELDPVVDRFFIVESNTTFTGLPKKTYFADNKDRFSKFEDKIVYKL